MDVEHVRIHPWCSAMRKNGYPRANCFRIVKQVGYIKKANIIYQIILATMKTPNDVSIFYIMA